MTVPAVLHLNIMANQLGTFFIQKIETKNSNLDNMAQGLKALSDDHAPVSPPPPLQIQLSYEEKVRKLINSSTKKKLHSRPYADILSDRLHRRAFTDHNENDQFITWVWAIRWWLEVCARPSTAEEAWARSAIQKLQTCQQPAVCFKADWKDGVWADTHPYDDSFTVSRVSVCIS